MPSSRDDRQSASSPILEAVVLCPSCAKRNRLRGIAYRCGSCGTELPELSARTHVRILLWRLPMPKMGSFVRARGWQMLIGALLLFLALVVWPTP